MEKQVGIGYCYRIYNVQEEDAGRYICTAQSSAGSSRDYSVLHVSSKKFAHLMFI